MRAQGWLILAAFLSSGSIGLGQEANWWLDVSPGSVQLGEFAWSAPRVGLLCQGQPQKFVIRLRVGTTRRIGDEVQGPVHGLVRHPSTGERPVTWAGDRSWVWAPFPRSDLEALASAGELVVQVELPSGEVVEHALPNGIPRTEIERFLGACDLPFAWEERSIEYDGARVLLDVAVTDEDLAAVLALARESGLPDAERVWIGGGVNETFARVESSWVVGPALRTRASISVFHEYWSRRRPHGSSRDLWYVSTGIQWDERHVIRDGAWEVEIRLGSDVTLATASGIVLALRRGEWIDTLDSRLTALGVQMPAPDYFDDRSGPLRLARAKNAEGSAETDVFELDVPSSQSRHRWAILRLRVRRGDVELLFIGAGVDGASRR